MAFSQAHESRISNGAAEYLYTRTPLPGKNSTQTESSREVPILREILGVGPYTSYQHNPSDIKLDEDGEDGCEDNPTSVDLSSNEDDQKDNVDWERRGQGGPEVVQECSLA